MAPRKRTLKQKLAKKKQLKGRPKLTNNPNQENQNQASGTNNNANNNSSNVNVNLNNEDSNNGHDVVDSGQQPNSSQQQQQQQHHNAHPVIRTLYDHSEEVTYLQFHPTAPILASGSQDMTIKFYDFMRTSAKRALPAA